MNYATTRTFADIPDTSAPTIPVSYTACTMPAPWGWDVTIPRAPMVPSQRRRQELEQALREWYAERDRLAQVAQAQLCDS